jgi:uncharacterized protein (DUF952 family)
MAEIFHITGQSQWDRATAAGEHRMSTRDLTLEQEGFIHCCLPHQLRGVAERYYADADDLVVLVIDETRLTGPVRYERPAPGADAFPHIYGPVPVGAVTSVIPVSRDASGRFVLPEAGRAAPLPEAGRTAPLPEA